MYEYGYATNGWETLFLGFGALILLLVMIMVVGVWLHDRHSSVRDGACRSAEEDLLFEKFANGELDDDEYRHHRERLRGIADSPLDFAGT